MKAIAYLLQAALISLWWGGLLIDQHFYEAFQFPGIGNNAFNSFMLPDLVIVALLSAIRAYKEVSKLDYIILGGFGFATLYCINATILTKGGYLPTTVMVLGLCYNIFLVSGKRVFRASSTTDLSINILKTVVQIICIWLITLFVFPTLILKSFGATYIVSNTLRFTGYSLFIAFSVIGILSAYVMVKVGKGTPLPLDQTQKLVTQGPYKYVRNPMAIAGIGQAISIGIFLGSLPIILYALLGAILWQLVVRPLEEEDMKERFGQAYEEYRQRVRCWFPTIDNNK